MNRAPESYMRETLALAEDALARGELPIAALVVLDGQIIASATTCEKTEQRYLVHAELLALEKADRIRPFPGRRRDCQLYTNLEPCMMCLGAAMSFFCGGVTYALESPGDGAVTMARRWESADPSFPAYRLPAITGGVLRLESIRLFQMYVDQHEPGPMRDWAQSLAALA